MARALDGEQDRWAERLAACVAPDETDLAPDVLAAYVAGGRRRRALLAAPRADPGAFGATVGLVLPVVLDALGHCAVSVKAFLGDPAVASSIASGSLMVALRQLAATPRRPTGGAPGPAGATGHGAGAAAPPPGPAAPPRPAAPPVPAAVRPNAAGPAPAAVLASLDALTTALARRGVPPAHAAALAAEVLGAVAEDPPGSAAVLDRLRNR